MDNEQRIEKENARLLALFDGADQNKMDFIREQIRQLAFINITLLDLQQSINQEGTKEHYDNGGGQSGKHANPDLKTLIDLQKLAVSLLGKLLPLVPEKPTSFGKLDEFLTLDTDDI